MDNVMNLAQEEAHRLNSEYIGTEHLLLGILREGGVGTTVLRNLNVDFNRLYWEIERLLPPVTRMIPPGQLPFSPRSKMAIQQAVEAASQLGHEVGTGHLLLGLLKEKDGIAGQALTNIGLNVDDVRRKILEALGTGEIVRPVPRGLPVMVFPPLPVPLNPEVMPDSLVFPPFSDILGKRIATQREYGDEVDRLTSLCDEKEDEAACKKVELDDEANSWVFEIAGDMGGEIKKHWPLKEIFRETRERLKASRRIEGQPLRIGRIMDIDPSRNLEEQITELLFADPKLLIPFIDKWPTEQIWDEFLYPHLYAIEWGFRDAGQPEDIREGAYSLDWSPDHSGIDIMFTPARAF